MTYVFALRPVADEKLLPQLGAALEKRTELLSREQLPGLWKVIDDTPPASVLRRRRIRYKVWGVLLLVLGVLLFVPGLTAPRELSGPLIVGAVAIAWGLFSLVGRGRKPKGPDFDSPAQQLLRNLGSPARAGAHAIFSEDGLTLETPDGARDTMAYAAVEYALETRGLLLLTDASRVVTLQKSEISWGDWNDFREFLSEKVPAIVAIE